MMKIRPAQPGDFEAFCSLAAEAARVHTLGAPRYFKNAGSRQPRGYFDSQLDQKDSVILFAEVEGKIAGFVHLQAKTDPDIPILVPMKYTHIGEIVVGEAFQRKGVGKALMERARVWARERGSAELRLNVSRFNEGAREFYLNEGFTVERYALALPLDQTP